MPITDDEGLDRLLDADTVAVIGCSTTPGKAAHDVPAYLQRHGYRVIPVNPFADEVLGEPAYDELADVEADVDLVNVFRPSEEIPRSSARFASDTRSAVTTRARRGSNWGSATTRRPRTRSQTGSRSFRTAV